MVGPSVTSGTCYDIDLKAESDPTKPPCARRHSYDGHETIDSRDSIPDPSIRSREFPILRSLVGNWRSSGSSGKGRPLLGWDVTPPRAVGEHEAPLVRGATRSTSNVWWSSRKPRA